MARSNLCPQFFAPYLPRIHSQKLMIPRALLEFMNVIPERVMLKDPIGRSWQVGVRKTYTGVYFMNGWEAFVKENSIIAGEFIVFKYNGDNSFTFHVYEHSGCERKYSEEKDCDEHSGCERKYKEEEGCDEAEREDDNDDDGDGDDDDDDNDDDDDDDDDEDYDADGREDYDNDGDDDDDSDMEEAEHEKKDKSANRSKKGTSGGTKPVEPDLDVENYVDYRNPYFVTKAQIRKGLNLVIPKRVIKKFKLNLHPGKTMILREPTPLEKEWKVEVQKWRDGRTLITGWYEFCKGSKVTKDDRCICEFTSVNGNVINVHIVGRNAAKK